MPKLQNETELTKARDDLSKKFIQISETSKVKLEKQIAEANSLLGVIKEEGAAIMSQFTSLQSAHEAIVKSEAEHRLKVDKMSESSKILDASQISTAVKLAEFKAANDITSHNALVAVMNKSVEDHNALITDFRAFDQSLKTQVESYNALAQKFDVAQKAHNDLVKTVNGAISILHHY